MLKRTAIEQNLLRNTALKQEETAIKKTVNSQIKKATADNQLIDIAPDSKDRGYICDN